MVKKKSKSKKAKEYGKIQDQNMAAVAAGDDEVANGDEMTPRRHKEAKPKLANEKKEIEKTSKTTSINQDNANDDEENNIEQKEEDVEKKVAKEMKRRKKKALTELKSKVEDAILNDYLLDKPDVNDDQLKEIKLWGVPLMPTKHDERTDVVLIKFLKAKEYKVGEAFEMLQKTLKWREEFKADQILDENLGPDFGNMAYLNSKDKEGHPLYYNVFGFLKDRQIVASEENCTKFLRWRVQHIENCMKELSFEPGGANSMVQIIDLKHTPGPSTKELRSLIRNAWTLLRDHYPGLVHRNIIINVPLWYYVSHVLSSRLKTQKKNSKVVFARPGKVSETLLKFISPENLPFEYGGLKRENDTEFSPDDKVLEYNIRANTFDHIVIPTPEVEVTVVWDFTVVGWDVTYKEEFVPDDEGSYTVLLQQKKERKGGSVRNSFYINEPGKIVITIENFMLKRKKVLYRYKTKPTVPMYLILRNRMT